LLVPDGCRSPCQCSVTPPSWPHRPQRITRADRWRDRDHPLTSPYGHNGRTIARPCHQRRNIPVCQEGRRYGTYGALLAWYVRGSPDPHPGGPARPCRPWFRDCTLPLRCQGALRTVRHASPGTGPCRDDRPGWNIRDRYGGIRVRGADRRRRPQFRSGEGEAGVPALLSVRRDQAGRGHHPARLPGRLADPPCDSRT